MSKDMTKNCGLDMNYPQFFIFYFILLLIWLHFSTFKVFCVASDLQDVKKSCVDTGKHEKEKPLFIWWTLIPR